MFLKNKITIFRTFYEDNSLRQTKTVGFDVDKGFTFEQVPDCLAYQSQVDKKFSDYLWDLIISDYVSNDYDIDYENPNDLVDKLNFFEQQGRILGIIDDRGKYIYITEKEMSMIEKMFMNRGRITKAELIKECNRLIKFEPTEEDKVKIAEEQKKMLEKIENEISDNNTNAKK